MKNVINTPQTDFASQGFTLWDYCEDGTDTKSFVTHYTNLVKFVSGYGIKKVIIFPKDPDTNSFFNLTGASAANQNQFPYWVNQLYSAKCSVEILFEYDAFNNTDTNNPIHTITPPAYFQDLTQKLNWVDTLLGIVSTSLHAH